MDKKEQAKRMYEKGLKYKEISEKLSIPLNTLKSWRKRYGWQRGGATLGVQPNNRGAPEGNKNAVGNKGNKKASPPKRNKNALKTGEYETIFFDTLSDDEKDIYSSLDDDPSFVLSEEIRLLKIRQLRMMKRIKEAESGLNDEEVGRLQQLRKIKTPIEKDGKKLEIKREVMQDVQVSRKTYRKIDDILSIEDALTRISNQLTKAIKQLNALATEESRNKVYNNQANKLEVEIDMLKLKADLLRSDSEKSTEEKLDELLERISGELDGAS
ncbi:phage terminase small subunit [Enterococcus mundtii]